MLLHCEEGVRYCVNRELENLKDYGYVFEMALPIAA